MLEQADGASAPVGAGSQQRAESGFNALDWLRVVVEFEESRYKGVGQVVTVGVHLLRAVLDELARGVTERAELEKDAARLRAVLHVEKGRDGGFSESGLLAVGQALLTRREIIESALQQMRDGRMTAAVEILKTGLGMIDAAMSAPSPAKAGEVE